jgi:hypothetical protein
MTRFASILFAVMSVAGLGCTTHHVKDDYPRYLDRSSGKRPLPRTRLTAAYMIDPATQDHEYVVSPAGTDYGQEWVVEFGDMLDQTLRSRDVQAAFGKLERRRDDKTPPSSLVKFELLDYSFADSYAHIELRISLLTGGVQRFARTYRADGKSQHGKVVFAGPFGVRNAVQQSTKLAMDEVLGEFIGDVNDELDPARRAPSASPPVDKQPEFKRVQAGGEV